MKINYKQLLLLSAVAMIAVNSYLKNTIHNINDKNRPAIDILLAFASASLFLISVRKDKENEKKKIVLAGLILIFTMIILNLVRLL